eukprot:GHVR01178459.1.p1 GENE.GHVR01178459.1~~GHVR01178459.1.p1  ORF type:complete len:195 (-),score=32.85 GHVR01178459.1:219-803(-)
MGSCGSSNNKKTKKLKFSQKELKILAKNSNFSYEEVRKLYIEFLKQVGKRQPLQGGLTPVQFLGLFNLSNTVAYSFADRFVKMFWKVRTEEDVIIGFEEFIEVFSVWTRGTPTQRLELLFELYDRDKKKYIVREDIVDFLKSIFMAFLSTDVVKYSPDSPEFKAAIEIKKVPEEVLVKETNIYFAAVADNAIIN